MDSHADTCVGGANSVIISESGETATVYSFSDEREPFGKIPIASIGTAWTSEKTGETFVLVFNEALYFGDRLPHSLLCPNQLRSYGAVVQDCPQQFDRKSNHSISIAEDNFSVPLEMDGVISFFESHRPSEDELRNCKRMVFTSDSTWQPNDPSFATQEQAMQSRSISDVHADKENVAENLSWSCTPNAPEFFDDSELGDRLIASVRVASDDDVGDGLHGHSCENIYPYGDEERKILSLSSAEKKSFLTKEVLAQRWGIGLETANRTMQATTQRGIKTFLNPTDRRLSTRHPHLAFPVLRTRFYTDSLFSKLKSLRQNEVGQVWTDGQMYSRMYPMKSKKEAYTSISQLCNDLAAIPAEIVSDGAMEETGGNWKKEIQHYRIKQRWTEPYSQWQNRAESDIREIKRGIRRATKRQRSPKRLWDFCGTWVTAVRRKTAHDLPGLNGLTPEERVHGRTPDISAYAQFDWYSYVWYIDPPTDVSTSRRKLGRWLGVAEDVGSPLTYVILPKSCRPIYRSSVLSLTADDLLKPEVILEMADLDADIRKKIGDERSDVDCFESDLKDIPQVPDDIFLDDEPVEEMVEPDSAATEADEWTPESYDSYLTAEILLDRAGDTQRGVVKRRKKDDDGNPTGKSNANPILDTRDYEVEFPDGSIDILSANKIAEAMYSQVDDEGRQYLLLSDIVDHRKDGSAVSADDAFYPGSQQRRMTTKGWQLLVDWKDGNSSWIALKDLKASNPVEVAEYAVANKIASEPAFAWWVKTILRQRDRNIMKVKTRFLRKTHKFGIEVPLTAKRAFEIDAESGTDFWKLAIEKEMRNVHPAFEILEDGKIPPGYKEIKCHMIFDIKMDFTRKARFVAGGHMTDPPKESVYSSVVSRESVRLFFLIAALNDLGVMACDLQNAYLNADTKEKNWFRAGIELGSNNQGKVVKIVRALYGLKSSGARWREHLSGTLRTMGYVSCTADPDVWMKSAVKADGTKYYEYVLCYVDDILVGSEHPQAIMDQISRVYTQKQGSVKEPDVYLGADVKKYQVTGDQFAWGLSSDSYCKQAVKEVERQLAAVGDKLATKVSSPMSSAYRPELDATAELKPEQASYYQSLIGILRWAVELGRIDIIVETGMLSRFCVAPRLGHLEQVLHVFAYLKKHDRSAMVFDPTRPDLNEADFKECDWTEYYPGAAEAIPPNMPTARGQSVLTTCFVDADHAGCRATRRSHTGVILFVNRAPIVWFSKRQNTVESSTFGSEFVAMRQAIELIEGLRYKLRMMGVPLDGATSIYCDNDAVVKSTTAPESTLKKKHNAICYHRSREAQAAGHVRIAKISGEENLADVFTKVVVGAKRAYLLMKILW